MGCSLELEAVLRDASYQATKFDVGDDLEDLEAPVRSWVVEVSADEILVAPLIGKSGVIGAIAVDAAVLIGLLFANWPTEAQLGY